jgi:hypothetical protein
VGSGAGRFRPMNRYGSMIPANRMITGPGFDGRSQR